MNTSNEVKPSETAFRIYLKFTAIFTLIFASIAVVFAPLIPTIMDLYGYKSFLGINFSGQKEKSYVNVLLMGLDKSESLSDVMMVAQLNLVTNGVNVLQIPRDTYIDNNRGDKKINSAYSAGGPENSIKELQTIIDLDIDGYVSVTTSGFRDVIDAVGGIYYDVPQDMNYEDPYQDLYIHLEEGYQLLDGDKAEQYVRYRAGYVNGDIGRVEAQSDFIKEAIRQIVERNVSNKEADTSKLITSLSTMVDTDFTLSEMLKYAPYILNINMDNVNVMMIEGYPEYRNNISYFIADEEANERLVREYFTPDISEADLSEIKVRDEAIGKNSVEHYVSEAQEMNIPESDINVYILDYSCSDGEALEKVTATLESYGYNIVGSVSSETAYVDNTCCVSSVELPYAAKVAGSLGLDTYMINPEYSNDADVIVIIGKDIK